MVWNRPHTTCVTITSCSSFTGRGRLQMSVACDRVMRCVVQRGVELPERVTSMMLHATPACATYHNHAACAMQHAPRAMQHYTQPPTCCSAVSSPCPSCPYSLEPHDRMSLAVMHTVCSSPHATALWVRRVRVSGASGADFYDPALLLLLLLLLLVLLLLLLRILLALLLLAAPFSRRTQSAAACKHQPAAAPPPTHQTQATLT